MYRLKKLTTLTPFLRHTSQLRIHSGVRAPLGVTTRLGWRELDGWVPFTDGVAVERAAAASSLERRTLLTTRR